MKLTIKEPTAPKYIYINPKTNTVHLLMPIMSGTEIGLDNTCKSVYSLQEFFGLAGADKQKSALGVLTHYKAVLEFDLKYMPASAEKTAKAHRLSQIDTYLDILKQVQQDTRITHPLIGESPVYPEPLARLMQSVDANLHSIILRPRVQDYDLHMAAIEPTFSTNHNQMRNNEIVPKASLFGALRDIYQTIPLTPKSKEGLIAHIVSKHKDLPVNFAQIKVELNRAIKAAFEIDERFEQTQNNQANRTVGAVASVSMNQPYLDKELGIDADNPATTEDYVRGLIEYCTPNLFDCIEESPFYTVSDPERLSILTQFFLANFNIVCCDAEITTANFGQILEHDADLIQELGSTVKKALEHNKSVEESLIQYINQYQARFELTQPLDEESIPTLKEDTEKIKLHWEEIKESPHFDEFMLLAKKSGLFVTHQYCMAIHFAHFLQMGWQDNRLDTQLQDFNTVDKSNNVIPYKNEHIDADIKEIELDLSSMDQGALQALYEDINTYPDNAVKETLFMQLKQERPDFKPKIDAKQFLQHVAYGEQDEAEALLLKDPEFAQELLRADNIPFTDYSGRTFDCTAYEYAYWAKDSHMQRMLEKYIRINEETRQLIETRAQDITKLVPSTSLLGLCGRFFKRFTKPQGLHYTTKDKQGVVIEHQDAGFDLTPLINALNYYVTEYNKKPYKTEADFDALEKIWIEKVGRAQRDVPAHIAHEYCHPGRSFYQVNGNRNLLDASNPANLKRQLKLYNCETGSNDVWFSPNSYLVDSGLGFLYGILREERRDGRAARLSGEAARENIDSAALLTIATVRTKDREQSLLNLSQPLILQESQSHGP